MLLLKGKEVLLVQLLLLELLLLLEEVLICPAAVQQATWKGIVKEPARKHSKNELGGFLCAKALATAP